MSVGVDLQGENQIAGTIEAAIAAAVRGMDDASVSIIAGGRRGQAKNTIIAKVQAGLMRDPFYLDQQAMDSIKAAFNGLIASAYSTRRRALVLAGELMLNAIGRNVDRQQNPGGEAFKALTARYAAAKQRKFGFKVPILRASGDLLDGLRVLIDGLS
jgi:hypothetical protein